MLRVFVQRDGGMLPLHDYQEEAPIHNIVLGVEGLAYLVAGGWRDQSIELVVVPPEGTEIRVLLGPLRGARVEDCFSGTTGERYTLGLDRAVYIPTAYGLAAWIAAISDRLDEESHDPDDIDTNCPVSALVLFDWNRKPLYMLDAGSLYGLGMPCFVADDGIWRYEYNE